MPFTECVKVYGDQKISEDMMCVNANKMGESCQGDSGGPLVIQNPVDGSFTLEGITTWAFGCGTEKHPGYVTNCFTIIYCYN